MTQEVNRNLKLGAAVLAGTIAIIAALYYIGSQQQLFGSTIKIRASFNNVNGLRRGNSVRFTGIDIGTVESIEITTDTSVIVVMVIDSDMQRFIRKNAVAVIGTDGVMGNKLVNINPSPGKAPVIEDGDMLKTIKAVEMDATVRMLNNTSENINVISSDLREITQKLNSEQSLLNLMLDQTVADNVKTAIAHFKTTGEHTATLTGDLRELVKEVQAGKGAVGLMLTDTTFRSGFSHTLVNIHSLSDSLAVISGDFNELSEKLQNGEGFLGLLLTDTLTAQRLESILQNLENGSGNFNTNMINLQKKWPFKEKKKKSSNR